MKTKTKHQQKFKLSSFADFIFYCATTDWLCFVFPTILPPAGGYCAPAGARVHARAGLVVAGPRSRLRPHVRPFFCPPRRWRKSLRAFFICMARVQQASLPAGYPPAGGRKPVLTPHRAGARQPTAVGIAPLHCRDFILSVE